MSDIQPSGIYLPISVSDETVRAFIPNKLLPTPPITLSGPVQDTYEKANRALGRLDGISTLLPDTSLFIYLYVRKEAVLSSQIEGTQSSLSDLLLFEIQDVPGIPIDDLQEVSNYVAALTHGLKCVLEVPLSLCCTS